jgi:hypothetical protein
MRFLRIAEVEAVGETKRLGADARKVGGALVDDLGGARTRVDRDAAAVAVDRDRDPRNRRAAGAGIGRQHRQRKHRRVGLLGTAHGA